MDVNLKNPELFSCIEKTASSPEFREELADLLVSLCEVDTVPGEDIAAAGDAERRAFDILEDYIRGNGLSGEAAVSPIDSRIYEHKYFTPLYYTDSKRPYHGRGNLIYRFYPKTDTESPGIALNAHIDTVAPYFPPFRRDGKVFGRGAGDDKGSCAAIAGCLKLLEIVRKKYGLDFSSEILAAFVIDEETGGNGSLSLALDSALFEHIGTMIVVESFDQQIYPANRGALWYNIEVDAQKTKDPLRMMVEIIKSLEDNGRRLKEKGAHPLFPDRPLHTCQGMLGSFGEHPSRICPSIRVRINSGLGLSRIISLINGGLERYISLYGDRTRESGDAGGKPKLDKHYDLSETGSGFLLSVRGNSGHMGSSDIYDNAITKMAYMIDALMAGDDTQILLDEKAGGDRLILEGGQGFVPPMMVDDIRKTLLAALKSAAAAYNTVASDGAPEPRLSTEKLHNEAFERDPNSRAVQKALRLAEMMGFQESRSVRGAPVSCDARIFAHQYPEMDLFTTGPGHLAEAHRDNEKIEEDELAKGAAYLALYVLDHQGIL